MKLGAKQFIYLMVVFITTIGGFVTMMMAHSLFTSAIGLFSIIIGLLIYQKRFKRIE